VDQAVEKINELWEVQHDALVQRIGASERNAERLHEDYVRVPTLLDRATTDIKEVISQRISKEIEIVNVRFEAINATVTEKIRSLSDITTQQFKSIVDTFAEKDKAVSVGLSAQKESAAAQQASNTDATTKMENNFTTLIEQGRDILNEFRRNTEMQIGDIKSRLDKAEGGSFGVRESKSERRLDTSALVAVGALIFAGLTFIVMFLNPLMHATNGTH
jgi:hypothetical protein